MRKSRSIAIPAVKASFEEHGPAQRAHDERRNTMKDQNRVLARRGARDLDEDEMMQVAGGLRTATKCSVTPAGALDGDAHSECGGDI